MSRLTAVPLKSNPAAATPVYGLVLAGGLSSRMRTDKARLDYHGKPQLEWVLELLAPRCERAFVSLRERPRKPLPAGAEPIVDQPGYRGPAAGILSALRAHPEAAWLVLACDLPFVDADTLDHLLEHRDPAAAATAYRSVHDGLPEPLCAVWEPGSQALLEAFLERGRYCPRKFLIGAPVKLLDQPRPDALDNINTPAEFAAARRRLGSRP